MTPRELSNLAYLLLRGYTVCVTAFLRRRFGSQALGFPGLAAILIMIFYIVAHPESRGMVNYFGYWWVMLALQRIGHFVRRWRGVTLHSQFDGEPLVGVILPFLHVGGLPYFLDVLICLGMGWFLHSIDPAVGKFVFGGGIALFIKEVMDNSIQGREVERMHDAEIEQRAKVARWRSSRF